MQPSTAFGQELRKRRLLAGLSLTGLSGKVHYSKAQLSKVERGLKAPSRDLARLCDATLAADGELVSLLPETPGAPDFPATESIDEEVWTMQLSAEGPSWFQPVGRREVVAAGAASLMKLGGGTPNALPGTGSEQLLAASRSLFDHYRRLGQTVGPGFLLPGLIAQTHALREVSASADPRNRQELLALGSRYAEYVGWLVQETGDDRAALWWTQRAVDLATAGGDRTLAGYALVRRALVTLYREEAGETVALAQRAQDGALPPRIRGLAAQREAQGHAMAGDRDSCLRSLDRARPLLAQQAESGGAPVIGSMHLPDPVGMITGWCLYDLGRPQEAAEVLDRQLAQVPSHALRTQVRYGVRRALAHAAAGEIDHACELAGRLIDSATAVSSATIAADLRRLARILSRHPGNPAVRALAPRLSTSLPLTLP
ncbi:helix-turn-helix transcriptional regulator [Streptomyces sp. ACA25]|uniref:helix-turn-helix domain-containing protein n=1 Tax=Streptomyces sp. ACA25 TaxID=3022596 RepID=UPI0023078628|nr:helix-turn-helix transcriptional regulator [Streptomyces sp. ACA25]MDB1086566.1 helix-turn-helix transcriptional regulator [Streptomyces sp. ACA25]